MEAPFDNSDEDPLVNMFGELMKGLNKGAQPVFEYAEAVKKLQQIESVKMATNSHNEAELIADFIENASAGNKAVQCRMWGYVCNIKKAFEDAIKDESELPSPTLREVLASHVALMIGRKGKENLERISNDLQMQDKMQDMAENYAPRTDDEIKELDAEKKKLEDYLNNQQGNEE